MASDAAKAEWARAKEGQTGEVADNGAKTIFAGFGVGLLYTTVMKAFFGWKEYPTKVFGEPFRNASVSLESSPALLGVGYIIGPRIAAIMAAGRRARLPRADPDDLFLRHLSRLNNRPAGHDPDQRDGPGRHPQRLRALYRRGRGGGGRHHQPRA
jgi:hypothetical protein